MWHGIVVNCFVILSVLLHSTSPYFSQAMHVICQGPPLLVDNAVCVSVLFLFNYGIGKLSLLSLIISNKWPYFWSLVEEVKNGKLATQHKWLGTNQENWFPFLLSG